MKLGTIAISTIKLGASQVSRAMLGSVEVWSNNPIPGLSPALWLDSDPATYFNATSGGTTPATTQEVLRWEDKSGNGKHAIQGTATKIPKRYSNVINGRDVIRFDGYNDGMQIASITLPTFVTMFVVQSTTRISTNLKMYFEHGVDVNTNDGMFFNGTNSAAWVARRSAIHDGPSLDHADWIGSGWSVASHNYDGVGSIYKNGAMVSNVTRSGTARANSNFTAALNIGCRNQVSLFLTGDIAEILIFPLLSDANRIIVGSYLAAKYAL